DGDVARPVRAEELVALDEALDLLTKMSERQSKVVTYRFFGGLTHQEIAEVLGVSEPTVRRDWRLARAWLSQEIRRMMDE
ncbi:MAG: sigma-70 family RNA polymerase sigma factor, partial [Rhodothermales bacterium]|nr:sigma-70 family RNA polymerase sigma factor [Rhodothermales bacterium]